MKCANILRSRNAGKFIVMCGGGEPVGVNLITALVAALALKANQAAWEGQIGFVRT